jgi:hypothetical protein
MSTFGWNCFNMLKKILFLLQMQSYTNIKIITTDKIIVQWSRKLKNDTKFLLYKGDMG